MTVSWDGVMGHPEWPCRLGHEECTDIPGGPCWRPCNHQALLDLGLGTCGTCPTCGEGVHDNHCDRTQECGLAI